MLASLAACGGGGGGGDSSSGGGSQSGSLQQQSGLSSAPVGTPDAYRFLSQASFGPTPASVEAVRQLGYAGWIDQQLNLTPSHSHLAMTWAKADTLQAGRPTYSALTVAWWSNALMDEAQLRLRVAYALSQIMVVSSVSVDTSSVASYHDMLTARALGRYRDLIEGVALHPAMGQYLSHLANRKEDTSIGRVPDQNFAREVMQLFSIGLYTLDDAARPVEQDGLLQDSFTGDDVIGLSRVFTGWSWHQPASASGALWWQCFWRASPCVSEDQFSTQMDAYDNQHATSVKRFLGVTIPVQSQASARTSLQMALDRLASHPNTAPFISRQLIQKLVTSNPSDGYVRDIVQVWRSTDGNLGAVVKAILLHNEARKPSQVTGVIAYGKVREPVLRLSYALRALGARSTTWVARTAAGEVPFAGGDDSSDPATSLGQTPLRAPSVFNFYRPGYTPPGSALAEAGGVAPEMQLSTDTTTLGYVNFMAWVMRNGWGTWEPTTQAPDLQIDWSGFASAEASDGTLADQIGLALLGQPPGSTLRTQMVTALSALPRTTSSQRLQRIRTAALLVLISPDFLVQQ